MTHPLKHCDNCAFRTAPLGSTVCRTCLYGFAGGTAENWKPRVYKTGEAVPEPEEVAAKAEDAPVDVNGPNLAQHYLNEMLAHQEKAEGYRNLLLDYLNGAA
jgi:hypothetical protein